MEAALSLNQSSKNQINDLVRRLAQAARANDLGFTAFKQLVWPVYERAAHLDLLDSYLSQVTRYVETNGSEGIQYLIVEMPPRYGKSLTLGRLFTLWHMGRNPNHTCLLIAHTADLSEAHSRFVRDIAADSCFQSLFPPRLSRTKAEEKEWEWAPPHRGGLLAFGMTGSIVGRGANLVIIDDPIRSYTQAMNDTQRDKIYDIYQHVLYTRLEPYAAVILLSQRWHNDDLIGRVVKNTPPEKYVRLTLPALAVDGDALGREVGAPLWPERYNLEQLEEIRKHIGIHAWSAMYQQQPITAEGGLWQAEWIERQRVMSLPLYPLERIVVAIDPAVTSKSTSNETGIVVVGKGKDGRGYVLQDGTIRGTPHAWANRALDLYHQWEADRIVVEVNNGGEMVEHTLRSYDHLVPIEQVRASRGKIARAEPISALYERQMVSHLGHFSSLEEQMLTYTGRMSDKGLSDRLDALCWGLHFLFPSRRGSSYIPGLSTQAKPLQRRRPGRM